MARRFLAYYNYMYTTKAPEAPVPGPAPVPAPVPADPNLVATLLLAAFVAAESSLPATTTPTTPCYRRTTSCPSRYSIQA